jgi:periplasmic protein TonB
MNHHDQNPVRRSEGSADTPTSDKGLTHWLIQRAARGVPASLSERLEEEWLADMGSRTSPLSRLRFALGCCWATRVISLEHSAAPMSVASVTVGGKIAVPYLYDDLAFFFSRRSSTLVLVAALHVAVFYGLITSLGSSSVTLNPPPLQPRFLPAVQPHEPPPPLPIPSRITWQLDPPMPDVPPLDDVNDGDKIYSGPPDTQLPPTSPIHAVNRVSGGPGAGFPDAEDYYPSAAKRLEEQGISTVRVCVDAHGRLTSAPTTVQSSGSTRLDEGALLLARAGSGHYRASTEDGRAIDSCYAFRIRFRLKS